MIGPLMMCVGVVVLLIGMLAGMVMGIQQDFMRAPAHAHLPPEPARWQSCKTGSILLARSCFRRVSRFERHLIHRRTDRGILDLGRSDGVLCDYRAANLARMNIIRSLREGASPRPAVTF